LGGRGARAAAAAATAPAAPPLSGLSPSPAGAAILSAGDSGGGAAADVADGNEDDLHAVSDQ